MEEKLRIFPEICETFWSNSRCVLVAKGVLIPCPDRWWLHTPPAADSSHLPLLWRAMLFCGNPLCFQKSRKFLNCMPLLQPRNQFLTVKNNSNVSSRASFVVSFMVKTSIWKWAGTSSHLLSENFLPELVSSHPWISQPSLMTHTGQYFSEVS